MRPLFAHYPDGHADTGEAGQVANSPAKRWREDSKEFFAADERR